MSREESQETTQSDEQLRQSILDSPEIGWRNFLVIYSGFIKNLINRYGFTIEDSEEVLQEVYQSLLKDNSRFFRIWDESKCSFRGYLYVVISHAAISFYRSRFYQESTHHIYLEQDRGSPYLQLEDLVSAAISPPERLHRIQMISILSESLERWIEQEKVDPLDRKIVFLRLRGLTYKEISDLTGLTTHTVSARFNRLRPRLKKALSEKGYTVEN